MARVRLSKDGLEIAKLGFNVDTATPQQMVFSSNLPALRLYDTGVVTLAPFTGYLSDRFNRAIVHYSTPFPKPPLVLVAGIINSEQSDQAPTVSGAIVSSAIWAYYSIGSFTNRFELYGYSYDVGGGPVPRRTSTYRYFVFHNTMDDS